MATATQKQKPKSATSQPGDDDVGCDHLFSIQIKPGLDHYLQMVDADTGLVIHAMIEDVKRESEGEVVWSKDCDRAIGKATVKLLRALEPRDSRMTDELFAKYVTVDRLEEVMVRVGYKSDDMWCLIDEMIEDIWTHSKDDIPWSKPVERLLAKETVKLFLYGSPDSHSRMTVAKLQSILAALPESHVLDVNRVGNLRVTDHTGYFIGWVDFKDGVCYEYVGTEGVEERISIC